MIFDGGKNALKNPHGSSYEWNSNYMKMNEERIASMGVKIYLYYK